MLLFNLACSYINLRLSTLFASLSSSSNSTSDHHLHHLTCSRSQEKERGQWRQWHFDGCECCFKQSACFTCGDKSNCDDLHFFCITFLLHHVILFLIKPRQIRPGKLGFWCDKMEPRQIGLWKKVGVAKLTTEVTAHTAHCTVQCTYTVHDWGMFFSVEII